MKNALWLLVIFAIVVICSPILALGQGCQMYTYSDAWLDADGTVVATNYTEGDRLCGEYTAYADVQVRLPSGYSGFGSSYHVCCAEATAAADASAQSGEAFAEGANEVIPACPPSLSGSFSAPIPLCLLNFSAPPQNPSCDGTTIHQANFAISGADLHSAQFTSVSTNTDTSLVVELLGAPFLNDLCPPSLQLCYFQRYKAHVYAQEPQGRIFWKVDYFCNNASFKIQVNQQVTCQ
jgi:hypothetical protein